MEIDKMTDLKTRVQLEEEELVGGGVVEVFHCSSAHISNGLSQALCCALHLLKYVAWSDHRWSFLKDLLESKTQINTLSPS